MIVAYFLSFLLFIDTILTNAKATEDSVYFTLTANKSPNIITSPKSTSSSVSLVSGIYPGCFIYPLTRLSLSMEDN